MAGGDNVDKRADPFESIFDPSQLARNINDFLEDVTGLDLDGDGKVKQCQLT